MTFRARLLLGFAAVVLVPLAVLAYGLWRDVDRRLTAQYQRRVDAAVAAVERDLHRRGAAVAARLDALAGALTDDNRFRLAAVQGAPSERTYLLDVAGRDMRLAGLSALLVLDEGGRILSSGHFREEYDRLAPTIPAALATRDAGVTLLRTRTAEGWILVLAGLDSLRVGGRRFDLVGGEAIDREFLAGLAGGLDVAVSLRFPGGALLSDPTLESTPAGGGAAPTDAVVGSLTLPYVDAGAEAPLVSDTARIFVTQSTTELRALRRGVTVWFLASVGATAGVALLLAGWLASRLGRPLADLAGKTAHIDLDTLDVRFETERKDEIGVLARLLDAMTQRLRRSAVRLREAERRATLGDLARQVNHDIKNGLTPIRNVLRHLAGVARDRPDTLPAVFAERRGTLDSSVEYLENLAANYARLSMRPERRPCDVNRTARAVLQDLAGAGGATVTGDLAEGLPPVRGDDVALRRILENLMRNALESLADGRGSVRLETRQILGPGGAPAVRITVTDTGRGMTGDEIDRIFDDFYTTKETGTGLGLSVVRRLVMDLGGTLKVESEPGVGTRFVMEIPA
jgi:signal transduction histidine kinase